MEHSPTLVVDLDGTLLKTDMLVETGIDVFRHRPSQLLKVYSWLKTGKACLKKKLAEKSQIDVDLLPYNEDVLSLIQNAKAKGQRVVLATASDQIIANAIANHLGVFDDVLASDGVTNLSGVRKRDALNQYYGEGKYDYVGNSKDDLVIWETANKSILVDPPPSVRKIARQTSNIEKEIMPSQSKKNGWLKALRPHQWSKNALVFLPLFASHQFSDPSLLIASILAFTFFSMCASSAYLLNDILDLHDDRRHHSKKHRPFCSGRIPVFQGVLASTFLCIAGLAGSLFFLPYEFLTTLIVYYAITLSYSLILKRKVAIDVITLAMLYTIRIIGGALAIEAELTFWILTFSLFIFFSLALMKRYAELFKARIRGDGNKTSGRGYYPSDLEMISSMGVSNGYLSILFIALYIQDEKTALLYSDPTVLWLICPLLMFWVTRIWVITHRGEMHDDPVVFAIKDKISLVTVLTSFLIFGFAL